MSTKKAPSLSVPGLLIAIPISEKHIQRLPNLGWKRESLYYPVWFLSVPRASQKGLDKQGTVHTAFAILLGSSWLFWSPPTRKAYIVKHNLYLPTPPWLVVNSEKASESMKMYGPNQDLLDHATSRFAHVPCTPRVISCTSATI